MANIKPTYVDDDSGQLREQRTADSVLTPLKTQELTSSELETATIISGETVYDTDEDRAVFGPLKRYLVGIRDTGKKINTVADLEGDTPSWFETLFSATPKRDMLGYNSVGDGGGRAIYWDANRDKQDHDAIIVFSPTHNNSDWGDTDDDNWYDPDPDEEGTGVWVWDIGEIIDIRKAGAVIDGDTDNTVALNGLKDCVRSNKIKHIHFPYGTCLVSEGILFENLNGENDFNGLTISGTGDGSIIKLMAGTYNEEGPNINGLLRFRSRDSAGVTPIGNIKFENFKIDIDVDSSTFGSDNSGTGLQVIDETHSGNPIKFNNLTVVNCHGTGITADCHIAIFESIYIDNVENFHGIGTRSSVTLYNNIIAKNIGQYGIDFSGVHGTTDNNSVNIANNIWIEETGGGAKVTPETKELLLTNAYFINNTNAFNEAAGTDCNITFNNVTFENIENGFNLNDSVISFNNLTLINVGSSGNDSQAFLMANATGTNFKVFDHVAQEDAVIKLQGDCSIKNINFRNNEGTNIINAFTCDVKIDGGVIDIEGIAGDFSIIDFQGPDRDLSIRDISFKGDDPDLTALTLSQGNFRVIDNNFNDFEGERIDFTGPEELIMRNNKGYVNESFGIETFSGDGSQVSFNIDTGLDLSTHGSTDVPYWDVTAASSDANSNFYVQPPEFHNSNTLTVVFEDPPDSGEDNIILQWKAGFQVI